MIFICNDKELQWECTATVNYRHTFGLQGRKYLETKMKMLPGQGVDRPRNLDAEVGSAHWRWVRSCVLSRAHCGNCCALGEHNRHALFQKSVQKCEDGVCEHKEVFSEVHTIHVLILLGVSQERIHL